ncbi:hypothetical protein AB0J43_15460 [Nonomuraea fuscirosea]
MIEIPEIPEFEVHHDGDMYRAKHKGTGREIEAGTPRQLQLLACAVRIGADLARVAGAA